ncbi:ribosomal-protein-alanine N-acetyltransferase [Halomonas sp. ND22Bw]|uniref:[Ribosomal protein bS18]-alanine N-acetyltransferase n=1 Tax=Halomonas salina TaxID=42565 RepID=A0ABR4WXN5_9GAMM|nr:ribosomal protein S18-alanine N-acetyltransferase [Halomonas salina]KGE79497.1 alanine acetyltransferase [Halomonas salina]PSJ22900.1 ribosomal-protein-alanine N-acetyltransferase [Halomonas sp. ND22Bw]
MPEPRLRALGLPDLSALIELEASGQAHPWSATRLEQALAAAEYAVLGLEDAAGLIGHAVVSRQPFDAELESILIAPERRGEGLAGKLLAAVVERAREGGAERLLLEVRAGNAAAIALYRRAGFAEDGRRRGYYPPLAGTEREDALLMSRPLA